MAHVIGVDGCRSAWCAVSIRDEGPDLTVSPPAVYPSFRGVLASKAKVICVDIPIGLLDGPGQRTCDREARDLLGRPRRSSVFPPPCRTVLEKKNHKGASEANRRVSGKGLPIQTFAIMPKIREVDSLMTPPLQSRVREVHPEVCFWALNNSKPMSGSKKKPSGREERWRILRKLIPSLPPEPILPPDIRSAYAVDDYVDALVAAWTAVCIARDSADRIPGEPESDRKGLRMEMWFPAV